MSLRVTSAVAIGAALMAVLSPWYLVWLPPLGMQQLQMYLHSIVLIEHMRVHSSDPHVSALVERESIEWRDYVEIGPWRALVVEWLGNATWLALAANALVVLLYAYKARRWRTTLAWCALATLFSGLCFYGVLYWLASGEEGQWQMGPMYAAVAAVCSVMLVRDR
jgi:hypothetical protein